MPIDVTTEIVTVLNYNNRRPGGPSGQWVGYRLFQGDASGGTVTCRFNGPPLGGPFWTIVGYTLFVGSQTPGANALVTVDDPTGIFAGGNPSWMLAEGAITVVTAERRFRSVGFAVPYAPMMRRNVANDVMRINMTWDTNVIGADYEFQAWGLLYPAEILDEGGPDPPY